MESLTLDNAVLEILVQMKGTNSNYIPIEQSGLDVKKEITTGTDLGQQMKIYLRNNSNEKFEGIIHLGLNFFGKDARFFMPAFLYGRNRGDVEPYYGYSGQTVKFPRLSDKIQILPYSNYWKVRGDRLSHPVSIALCEEKLYGISIQPFGICKEAFNGFTMKMTKDGGVVGATIGYENAPCLYVDARTLAESNQGFIYLNPGEEICANVTIYILEASKDTVINQVIRDVYGHYHQSPRKGVEIKQAVGEIAEAIFRDAFVPSIPTYSTQVFLQGKVEQEPLASISWTGGVEVAGPILLASVRLNRPDMRQQALEVIQKVVDDSINEQSNLPFDACDENHWYTEGWWDKCLSVHGHTSYVVGQALYYILKCYEIERKYNHMEHVDWIAFVKRCLKHIETTKNTKGEVPYLWSSVDGSGLEYDSFAGCWCVAAAILYDNLCNTNLFENDSVLSLQHYYNTYVCHMECYGTPMDTYKAVDSEGVLAFIKACRMMHERTGKEQYMEMLKDGLEYEFTFKFCWNPPIQVPPLSRIGWSCSGGSVTSTCNPHIHPMSNSVCDDIAYCAYHTKDSYYKQRLTDTVDWGLQTYSQYDGEYDFGLKGWMSERFCYSEGLLVEQYEDGNPCSVWRCFLPWGASNILEGLCGTVWENKYCQDLDHLA